MRKVLLILSVLTIVLLSSCSGEKKTFYERIDEQFITVSVDNTDKYGADLFIAKDDYLTDEEKQKVWDDYIQYQMDQDHYLTMVRINKREENPFHLQEEERIERYCKEAGFAACRTIASTCERDGCHAVAVSCRDYSHLEGDPYEYCNLFDVNVEKEINDELTEAERLKECEENHDDAYISLTCEQMYI